MFKTKPILMLVLAAIALFGAKSILSPLPTEADTVESPAIDIQSLHRTAPLNLPVVSADLS